eukprot:1159594-Pelagomonas_calceolata.AAC.1
MVSNEIAISPACLLLHKMESILRSSFNPRHRAVRLHLSKPGRTLQAEQPNFLAKSEIPSHP